MKIHNIEGIGPIEGSEWKSDWTHITSNTTLESNKKYLINSNLTVNLPVSPEDTDQIWFSPAGDMITNNTTIGRDGNKIMGLSEDMDWDANTSFSLVYDDLNSDWRFA